MRARRGEVLAIRGSNGSGKSTLLRIVASALRPTRGTCVVFGHDVVQEAATVRKLVGLLGHSPALYQDLTVAENLRFAARMMGVHDDDQMIASLISRVALEAATHERARTLSSGMQRRVALARLMIRPPALLLLDEPHNSFDAEGVALVNDMMLETSNAGGVTILVTHDVERVGDIVDRVLTMENGRLLDDLEYDVPSYDASTSAPLEAVR